MSHWPILPILLPLFAGALLLILPSHERLKRTLSLLATLALLPGIGPRLAEAIVRERRRLGAFAGPDDLERVPGIGPATVQRLRPLVRFE